MIEALISLREALCEHLCRVKEATGREPEWSLTFEKPANGLPGAVCVVIVDGHGIDVYGRTHGEADRAALVAFRRWADRQVIVRPPRELVANDVQRVAR